MPEQIEIETRIAGQEMDSGELIASVERLGNVSKLTCPDCHGALSEIHDEHILRFRCHVGHAFSAEALSDGSIANPRNGVVVGGSRRKANHGRAAILFEKRGGRRGEKQRPSSSAIAG